MSFGVDDLCSAQKIVIGTKQTIKSLQNGEAVVVCLAKDAEDKITKPVEELCLSGSVPLIYADSMAYLGRACKIKVGAAAVAVIKI